MASTLALVLILAAYIVQGQSGDDKICGFDVDFDDWLGKRVPTNVLRIFCYSAGLCHNKESSKHAELCHFVAHRMNRLLNETSERHDVLFRNIQSVKNVRFSCKTVDYSKLNVNVSQDTPLSQVVIDLTSPFGCKELCANSGGLCYLAIELLQYSVPTTVRTPNGEHNGTSATRPTPTIHSTSNQTDNHASDTQPTNPFHSSNMPIYIILLVAAIFAAGLAYVAYINWGTVSSITNHSRP